MRKTIRFCFTVLLFLILIACRDIFQFSPHQTDIDSVMQNQTVKNITRLSQIDPGSSVRFSFAIVSDTHCHYRDFSDAIAHINSDTDIQFTIHAGDMTDFGLKQQYEVSCSILQKLNRPFFAVIGNHDCLGNGQEIYKKMFGDFFYVFAFSDTVFLLFHDNIWELDNIPPDINILDNVLASMSMYPNKILVGHIPPFGDQFDFPVEKAYRDLLKKHSVALSAHGHVHEFRFDPDFYNDGIPYLTVDTIVNRCYVKVTIDGDQLTVENVGF